MMKKNVQSKGHFKMYKAGKKWVSYGLSVMGVALVVGTPVMSATLQLTTPETASAASVQATDLTQVPGSVLTAARTQSNVDLSNNGEFSAWLVAAVKNWDNWSDQTAARNALAELGKAFAKNKKLKSVDLSGTFAAANAADTHGGHDAALLFWAMQLSDVKTASFETLDLSNNNFTPELTNTVYIADGINKTVKHLLFGNSSAELLATIHANGNNNYASDGHHGFGGKFIQADVSDTEMVPNEPQYMTSEANVPNEPQYMTSEGNVPNEPQYMTSESNVPNEPQYMTSEGNVPNAPVMASSANVPNDPIYVASSNVPNDPIYVASSNVPNDPIMTSEANVPNDPVMASSANVPNDPIYVASSNVPNDPIMTSEANVPNAPVMASSANVPNDPIYVASSNVPNAPIESPVNRVTADDTDRAKNAMTDEAAKQNVAENATVVASIDDIAHAETPAALQQAVDRAAVAISNAVSLPETAAKGAQDKNALLVALTIMASLVTFAFVQKRK
ncbi:KxYKxGKxW signal peptide domain-containing protein [Weissella confusa]|uniref:KxYKxGKxW signal peptide domain-containing protein n=1 Tax=Weissella confusa TaxID=1583 RepID=A0AAE2S5U2_WEICO|nr:KxYKxGKxW signal peptide domain-containing protein [Weissella confusa]MBJ7631759.1 KxYKxGKxW signal peptide domain-containing protein [Weissella confusa]MBJ7644532.1 KxYKxGKxW signal peptide domain-containing protein [Weissella confusa]MBJ7673180.1 KxYKxGKxW signal peptide domain-containing protein [Weissella confusa]